MNVLLKWFFLFFFFWPFQYHGDKIEVWIQAIWWEQNENKNSERVKSLLVRAQKRHPDNQKLFLTLFQIELENKCDCNELESILNNNKDKFLKIEFYIDVLNVVDKFSYAGSTKQKIVNNMREQFYNNETMWHTLAQRELSGIPTTDYSMDLTSSMKSDGEKNTTEDVELNMKELRIDGQSVVPTQQTLRKRIELCIQVYEEAVKVVKLHEIYKKFHIHLI